MAFATTECHLGVDGRRARALTVHQKVRTPYSMMLLLTCLQPGAQLATRSRFRAHNTTNNQGLVLLAEGNPPKCKICFPVLVKKHGEGDTTVSNCAGKV